MTIRTELTAAALYFRLKGIADELEHKQNPTRAEKRNLLRLRTAGLILRDRLHLINAKKLDSRA